LRFRFAPPPSGYGGDGLNPLTNQTVHSVGADQVRRSVSLAELGVNSVLSQPGAINLAGVRIAGIVRNADMFRQSEVRRTGSDAARAGAEVQGLQNIESAVEQTGVYDAIVDFEAALKQLLSDPTDGSLRASALEQARTLAQTFNTAASSLDAVGEGLRFEAQDAVGAVNTTAAELARVNLRLGRASDASSDQTSLLDQRDSLLEKLSGQVDISTTFSADGSVQVRIGGPGGPSLLNGGSAATLAMTVEADGTIAFTLGGAAATLSSGALAGKGQALTELAGVREQLNAIAARVISTLNTAQIAGADLTGAAGQPLLSGSGAADIALALTSGSQIATAPAGSGANSRDTSNLVAMRAALESADPAGAMDGLLFGISSAVAGRTVTRNALESIAGTAKVALQAQAGVDLDEEALNLTRFQQAFQASGRIMQVASDIFDSILAIR
ncbi:MAG: flagellar hook-associated protein 1 FlgK, partial [Novosphingobium lindaniclasticum]|uniref:flagellar hook-associated protein FlgK n=1 Tax=Novosphingobium lindaniclasticum TaxID=1329895 RepID=UPI002409413E